MGSGDQDVDTSFCDHRSTHCKCVGRENSPCLVPGVGEGQAGMAEGPQGGYEVWIRVGEGASGMRCG